MSAQDDTDNMTITKFWIVIENVEPLASRPTLADAIEEAERRARRSGKTAYIFGFEGSCTRGQIPVDWTLPA